MLSQLTARFSATEGLFRRLLIVCLTIGFASLIVAALAAALMFQRSQEHTGWVNHTYEVEIAIANTRTLIEQSAAARRGYLLTGQAAFLRRYEAAEGALPAATDRIASLTADNVRQQARISRLRDELQTLVNVRRGPDVLMATGRRDAARALFAAGDGDASVARVRVITDAMRAEEQRLMVQRDASQRDGVRTFLGLLAGAGLLIVVVGALAIATVLRYTRDLDRSSKAIQAMNEGLETKVAERTADLTLANEEIQRFAYIVSHDLRSPLVNVMGFTAELDAATKSIAALIDRAEAEAPQVVTREAEMAAREDLPEAIRFIRTSTAKMDRLINAILKLSREGRRVLTPEPLDMRQLVTGIRDTLVQLAEERGAEIVVAAMPDLRSDRIAIEQILSNLMENATKYLEDGRAGRIEVRGHHEGDKLIYEVKDNGRGIAPGDHARVFDLFRRAGKQDQPGEGIGLAHVRALAYRLGGNVTVASTLGEGSIFRLVLPATFDDRGEAEDGK